MTNEYNFCIVRHLYYQKSNDKKRIMSPFLLNFRNLQLNMKKHPRHIHLIIWALLLMNTQCLKAQYGNTPPLHVEGRQVVDPYGNVVNLHGVGVQPNWYWCKEKEKAWGSDYSLSNVKACLEYFSKDFDMLTDSAQGAYCNCIRLSADAAWVTDNGTAWDDYDPNKINRTKLKNFTRALFFPLAKNAIDRGMYVVLRPPTVFPYYDTTVGDDYNRMILDCFDIFSQNDSIKKYAGQIMFELGNEPINLWSSWDATANGGKGKGIWLATPLAEAITLAIAVAGIRIKKGSPLNLMRFCKK